MYVCVCVCACVRACVRVCACVCGWARTRTIDNRKVTNEPGAASPWYGDLVRQRHTHTHKHTIAFFFWFVKGTHTHTPQIKRNVYAHLSERDGGGGGGGVPGGGGNSQPYTLHSTPYTPKAKPSLHIPALSVRKKGLPANQKKKTLHIPALSVDDVASPLPAPDVVWGFRVVGLGSWVWGFVQGSGFGFRVWG